MEIAEGKVAALGVVSQASETVTSLAPELVSMVAKDEVQLVRWRVVG